MLVAVVALLVIGPDRLPKVARTLGAYTGRLQRYISEVKEEVSREINFEELQEMQQDIKAGVDEAKASIREGISQAKQTADDVQHAITGREEVKPAKSKATGKAPAKKPSIKKPSVKKAGVKKPTNKKAATKETASKRATTKRTTVKTPTNKKSTTNKTIEKKPVAKKPVAKKTASKKAIESPQ